MTAAVAFGLRALMCALKARAGKITAQDVAELEQVRLAEVPDDQRIADAVDRFRSVLSLGAPQTAGLNLLNDLAEVMDRAVDDASRTQAALAAAGAADWQQRSDLK